jgi:hypothetical protein
MPAALDLAERPCGIVPVRLLTRRRNVWHLATGKTRLPLKLIDLKAPTLISENAWEQ